MRNYELAISRNPSVKFMKNRQWKKPKEIKTDRKGSTDFLVRVMFRKNTTWQGEIHWLGSDKKRSFRSSLELMLLMQEAMDQKDTPQANYNLRSWTTKMINEEQNVDEDFLVSSLGISK